MVERAIREGLIQFDPQDLGRLETYLINERLRPSPHDAFDLQAALLVKQFGLTIEHAQDATKLLDAFEVFSRLAHGNNQGAQQTVLVLYHHVISEGSGLKYRAYSIGQLDMEMRTTSSQEKKLKLLRQMLSGIYRINDENLFDRAAQIRLAALSLGPNHEDLLSTMQAYYVQLKDDLISQLSNT